MKAYLSLYPLTGMVSQSRFTTSTINVAKGHNYVAKNHKTDIKREVSSTYTILTWQCH